MVAYAKVDLDKVFRTPSITDIKTIETYVSYKEHVYHVLERFVLMDDFYFYQGILFRDIFTDKIEELERQGFYASETELEFYKRLQEMARTINLDTIDYYV